MPFGLVLGLQLLLRKLADQRLRQLLAELDLGGHLDLRDARLQELQDFLGRGLMARPQLHESLRRLAAIGVGDADDRHLLHGGVLVDRLLDAARIDVEARAKNEVLDAVDDEGEAVAVHVGDVAGAEEFAR